MTLVTPPANALADASYVGHLLVLPTGQIMFTDFSTNVEVFTPAGTYNPAWAPTISSASTSIARGKTCLGDTVQRPLARICLRR